MSVRRRILMLMTCLGLTICSVAQADAVNDLLATYTSQGAGAFSSDAGQSLLLDKVTVKNGKTRSCTNCHGERLDVKGSHIVTGKTIRPMAPSVNPERLIDQKKIEKWFLRNCKWTFGRECTAQEKGDFLTFLKTQ